MKKVITYGTYDLFHEGHYKLLKRAKELGDYLIVGVTTEHFDEARGKVNLVDPIMTRIENVRKTGFADEIIIEDHEGQKVEDIQKYGVDVFTVGSDWTGHFDYLRQFCDVVYLERTPDISSTEIRDGRYKIVRIGIIGTGRIAPRFLSEAKYVSGINVDCAYNPEEDSAKAFHDKTDLPVYTRDFDKFLDMVDAVYIASPNETHTMYAKEALEAGKHVLCEKPLAFTKLESQDLYKLAEEKGKVLMEAVKTAYCPGFTQLINVAESGKIGDIVDVEACFTRLANPDSREVVDANFGGSFLEFGAYVMLPMIKLFGTDYKNVEIESILNEAGNDVYTKVHVLYDSAMATGKVGVGVKSEGNLVISGTKGYILAPSPWWLTKYFEVRHEDVNDIEVYKPDFIGDGIRYEISEFTQKINGVKDRVYKLTAEEAIAMAGITEMFMKNRVDLQRKKREENAN
ncbi:MAG: Gfo/Idh/MocA family oxidoreductase [Pseudobutyrivibrio sp.]|nr:Gfo/Idh/MocA family oxidoreductase [Pseudobutyrivibrio sp.]